jgi:glucose-1-phosphate cytidylyltransferase
MTGGRIKRARPYLDDDEPFCLTYGDGVSDINLNELIDFHNRTGALVTVSAVRPPGRFGVLNLQSGEDFVASFREKANEDVDSSTAASSSSIPRPSTTSRATTAAAASAE